MHGDQALFINILLKNGERFAGSLKIISAKVILIAHRSVAINLNLRSSPQNQIATLDEPFSEEEIKLAMWPCEESKAPGSDGFLFHFIKAYWDVLKVDIIATVKEFEHQEKMVKGANSHS